MKISGVIRVAGLLGLLLLFIAEAAGQTSRTLSCGHVCQTTRQTTQMVSTPWHFGRDRLSVPDSLPVGMVIAAAVLPAEQILHRRDRNVSGGLWGSRGPAASWLAVRTALEGVMVRIVPDDAPGGEWSQGEIRIELVKTGVMRTGVLQLMREMPEYRLWRNRQGGRQVLLRERLVMDRPLTVAVMTGVPTGDPVIAAGEEG
ncbi:hypothetical protein [Yokenella regensburgei]|uniref:Uncharacterized protein n=1 Tax=Yokenella regensburgei TaxID=158877 RepID=A0AB38FVD7_9ENTR|nr:hypothetical protein [Yokenella regensburgei]KFD24788.1 hypothetical protein GYRE_00757 [Yokenella regensburgei ATCC 49455]SQA62996.1 Uncharacterised protein [Yokenella regensburgei]SQB02240.1 Uncharacterised protein [Yokenella regensburgei]SUQ07460.1 Uncharacterised protein [Yokenella regensburgei]